MRKCRVCNTENTDISNFCKSCGQRLWAVVPLEGNLDRERQLVTYGYDLMQMTTHYPTCGECAKYQDRVFSISGKDKRFPPLSIVPGRGHVHEGCAHVMVGWVEEFATPQEVAAAIRRSNRPFVDDRSQEEKRLIQKRIEDEGEAMRDKQIYDQLVQELPDIAPKSCVGFRRMKKMQSKNFLRLQESAKEKGIYF